MANKSNNELHAEIREYRKTNAQLYGDNERLAQELDRLQAEINETALTVETMEYEIKRLKKDIGESITKAKLQAEKKMAYARGYAEGVSKR